MSNFFKKLSSRKLWVALVGIVIGVATIFGIDEGEYTQISGIVMSLASVITYIISEASVDAAHKKIDTGNESINTPESPVD